MANKVGFPRLLEASYEEDICNLRTLEDTLRDAYKHCEYQSFTYVHVDPATQVVGPFQLLPPHWPYFLFDMLERALSEMIREPTLERQRSR